LRLLKIKRVENLTIIKMKYIIILILFLFTYLSCDKNTTEPKPKLHYWTSPTLDAVRLSYRLSDSVQLDSIFAGEIQFRLDVARTVDERLTEFPVWKDWELGKVLMFTTDELYSGFDTTTYRFNYQPLDSILSSYDIQSGYKRNGLIRLIFPQYYNIRILSEIISKVEGVNSAEPNHYDSPGLCDRDIKLEIDDRLYIFNFSEIGSMCRHYWEVHVIDDKIEYVTDWE
jgi:hypothetical protein